MSEGALQSWAYKPSPWGALYHALEYDEVLGAGAAGPGKTAVLIAEPLAQIVTEHDRMREDHPKRIAPGSSLGWCLHLRRTVPMIEQTIVRASRLYKQLDPGAEWEASKLTWHFSSGYRVQFGSCNEVHEWEKFYSSEYSLIIFDELVQFHEEQYDQIITRLRSSDPVLSQMLKVRCMSNPFMRRGQNDNFSVGDPQWVKRRFIDPAPTGKVVIKKPLKILNDTETVFRTRMYLPATLYDNPDKAFVRNYDIQLANSPPHIQQALRYGSWEMTEGSFFGSEWRPNLHICEPFEIPPHWPMFRSMDWGFKQPGNIHWWAMDDDDNVYCVREMRFHDATDVAVAKAVREVEKAMGLWRDRRSALTGPADTQLWEMRGDSLKSKAQVFNEMGVPWKQADKRSRQRNAELLTKRLKDHRNGTVTPGIVFFSTCRHAIRTIPAMQVDGSKPEEPAKGGDDHAYDSVAYACAYASHGRAGLGNGGRWDDEDEYEQDLEDRVQRGRYGYGSTL